MKENFFRGKQILILGGTGSIGKEILHSLIKFKPKLIKVFSRDEYKQHKLRYKYFDVQNLDYVLGDIRDLDSLISASKGMDIIFHTAALKHISISEEMPEEFIKTNVLGSLNVKKATLLNKIPLTVSISSDKAVDPTNLMGLTKGVQEKIFSSHYLKERTKGIKFITVRFGNVIGTHGSFFPIIYHQIINKQPITITYLEMTRFYMSQKEATDLIFWSAINGKDGEIIIKKMKSATIQTIVKSFLSVLKKKKNWPLKHIGIRVGEKMHESLITEDNLYRIKEMNGYYIVSPYNKSDIISNQLLIDSGNIHVRKKFISNNPNNYFTKKEIINHIEDFIREKKREKDII